MNIQIGENTYNHKSKMDTSDYANYTYSKNSVQKNDYIKDKGKTDKLWNMTASDAIYSNTGSSFATLMSEGDGDAKSSMAAIPDSTLEKNYMVVMSNTLSDEDFKKLGEDGFHPGDMEAGEMVTIVDRIKTTMAKSGQVIEGYNDDMDMETLEAITGSAAYAEAIASAFRDKAVPMTEANVSETSRALDMAEKLVPVDGDIARYMVSENMQPTIENIYKAEHSGAGKGTREKAEYYVDRSGYLNKAADDKGLDSLDTSMKNIIASAGYEVNEENMSIARDIVSNGIALTEEALDIYRDIKALKIPVNIEDVADRIASTIADGRRPGEASLTDAESLLDKASRLVEEAGSITDEDIENVVSSDRPLTLRSLTNSDTVTDRADVINNQDIISAKRLVNEIRLSMTVSSTYVLLKNNISVDTTELSLLVDELKEAENRQFESVFGKQFVADKEGISKLFDDTVNKVSELKDMPIAAIGRFAFRSSVTLNIAYEEASNLAREYKAASLEYEKMFTEVRTDLGDSIRKAFRNAEDILGEIGLERNEDNAKAVRILGYNQMEITSQNISIIRDAVDKVEGVIARMQPASTLELIRQGVNPLEVDLDELSERLRTMDTTDNEPERFSVFLNKLDEAGSITSDERQSFIGIYRMINAIEKNDSAAIGTLINSRAEINFKNLLSAVRSGKHKGLDVKIDDNNGELEQLITKGISISEQIGKAYSSKSLGEEIRDIRSMDESYQEIKNYLEDMGIRSTINNMQATKSLADGSGRLFAGAKKNIKSSKLPEFENITSKIIENFTDKDSATSAYDEMAERLKELVNAEALDVTNTINLKEMSFSLKQLFVATKLTRDEYYEVPMNIGEEVSSVSIRITHGDDKGVRISFSSERYGNVSGKFWPGTNGYEGLFQTDGTGEIASDDIKASLMESYDNSDLSVSDIIFNDTSTVNLNILTGQADNNSSDVDAKSSTADMYKLAKVFIETLSR